MTDTTPNATAASHPARPTTVDRRILSAIVLAENAAPRDIASTWGPHNRGVLPIFFTNDGTCKLGGSIRLIPDGLNPTGFAVGNLAVDYADLANTSAALAEAGEGLMLAASNLNVARRTRPAEEALFQALRATPLGADLAEALSLHKIEANLLPRRIAARIAHGVVTEAITTAIAGPQTGALNLIRAYPPSLRRDLAAPLLDGPLAEQCRALLQQVPIIGLAPELLEEYAGEKPSALLKALELPTEAKRILPRALSSLARWLRVGARQVTGDDLGWITAPLCHALPDHDLLQHRAMLFAYALLTGGAADEATAAMTTWAAERAPEVLTPRAPLLRDWLLADPLLLDQLSIRRWHAKIGAEAAFQAADRLASAAHLIAAAEGTPFPLPGWAFERQLPASTWWAYPLCDESALIAEGNLMRNCLATYASRCRAGTVVLSIRRPARAGEKDGTRTADGAWLIGADAEITRFAGEWQAVQIKGPANGPPPSTACAALIRFLDEINA